METDIAKPRGKENKHELNRDVLLTRKIQHYRTQTLDKGAQPFSEHITLLTLQIYSSLPLQKKKSDWNAKERNDLLHTCSAR